MALINVNYACDADDYWGMPRPHLDISGGPSRVEYGKEDKNFKRNPVGFVWPAPVENEPLLWNGDNA